jgi:hypothetical protein
MKALFLNYFTEIYHYIFSRFNHRPGACPTESLTPLKKSGLQSMLTMIPPNRGFVDNKGL